MKIGKTSFAAQLPKNLILATELGTNAIGGLYVQPIQSWSDIKTVLRQLRKPEAREMFNTITIDTMSIAADLAEKYICMQNNVNSIGDIPYGGNLITAA